MHPTLEPGDRLYVDRTAYRHRPPAVGDIVVTRDPTLPRRYLVKRVAPDPARVGGGAASPGSLYLLGDDPGASRDSRQFGAVPLAQVVGRVYRCYDPPERRRDW